MPHTPGPWFATDVDYPDDGTLTGGDTDDAIWTVSTTPNAAGWRHDGGYPGYGVTEANAKLMAAAPDLLAAIQNLLHCHRKYCETFGPGVNSQAACIADAEAAISKATS